MVPSILAAGSSLMVLAGGIWVGWTLLGRPARHPPSRDVFVAAWIGWYVQGMAVLVAGWLGFLSTLWLSLLLLVPLVGAILDRRRFGVWLRTALRDYRRILRAPVWAWLLAGAACVWVLLQLSAPPFHYDLLTYGFGQPLHWLADGRIGPVGPDINAYEAVPSRMHFLLSLGLGGAPMAGFSLFLWTLLGALLVARIVDALGDRPSGRGVGDRGAWPLLAATALLITPAIWDLLLLRKDDLCVIWGGAALLLLHIGLWQARRLSLPDLMGLAVAAAAVLAAKPAVTGGYVLALVALTWWRPAAPRRLRSAMILCGGVFVALLPVAVHTWLGLGHPLASLMPYLSRYDIASTRWYDALADAHPWQSQPLQQWVPYAVREFSRFFNPNHWNFGDNMGLLVLLGLPLGLLATRRRGLALIWLAGMAGWFFTFHWPRFSLVLLPLEVLLVVELLRRTMKAHRVAVVVVLVACVHVYFYAGLTVTGSQVFRPAVRALFGGQQDLAFVPPSVRLCKQVNATLDPRVHRLMFVGETRAYPCAVPFEFWNAHFRHPFERVEHGVEPAVTWDRYVAEQRITHIVYSPEVARKRMEWSPQMHLRLERWLQERGTIVARENSRESTAFLVELGGTQPGRVRQQARGR